MQRAIDTRKEIENRHAAQQLAAEATARANQLPPVKTPAEIAMEQAIAEQRAEQLKQAQEYEKVRKERIRVATNERFEARAYLQSRQPSDNFDKPIGNRGYAWQQNFKAGDGNWYAEYRANVGGRKMRIYAISTQEWLDEYDAGRALIFKQCPNCAEKVWFVRDRSGYGQAIINHCPKCNHQYSVSMYGSLSEVDPNVPS